MLVQLERGSIGFLHWYKRGCRSRERDITSSEQIVRRSVVCRNLGSDFNYPTTMTPALANPPAQSSNQALAA